MGKIFIFGRNWVLSEQFPFLKSILNFKKYEKSIKLFLKQFHSADVGLPNLLP